MNNQDNILNTEEPAGKLLNAIIVQAVKDKASEIYIVAVKDKLQVNMLIDDFVHDIMEPSLVVHPIIMKHLKRMANLEPDKWNALQHGGVELIVEDKVFIMDVAIAPTEYGEKAVLKLSKTNDHDKNAE